MHIFINLLGVGICGLALGIALAVGHFAGTFDEGPLMIVFGPLCIGMDVAFRFRRPERRWFHPDTGGSVFFIPLWVLGILWLVLGVVYTIQGHA